MKITAFIATAILAYTTAAVAVPIQDTSVDTFDDTDAIFPAVPELIRREAEPRRRRTGADTGWNSLPGQARKRDAMPEPKAEADARRRRHGKDTGWNSLPGQARKRDAMPEAEAEADARRRRHGKDTGWNSLPGQA
ncbi:Protein EFR3 [Sphaceloma murrayae]|uniref:Protein EFR3 n=1 Tax=Sphaceloma murrayae TaxID=2082308 RepID=A0A2K1QS15_9PEZI|nr:Protein EFR3 [Sphaceloma murrayae]